MPERNRQNSKTKHLENLMDGFPSISPIFCIRTCCCILLCIYETAVVQFISIIIHIKNFFFRLHKLFIFKIFIKYFPNYGSRVFWWTAEQ